MEEGHMEFAARLRALARDLLPAARTSGRMLDSMRRLTEEAEGEVRSGAALPVACAPGCSACCVLNVAVLFPEAIAAVGYLRDFLPAAAQRETAERLEALYWHLAWLEEESPAVLGGPCAFLDPAGRCRIYPVRPLLCRSVTSTDGEACRQALALQAQGIVRPVLMDVRRKEVMETAFREIALALEEAGFDSRGGTLTETVRFLLHDPAAIGDYLAGRPQRG